MTHFMLPTFLQSAKQRSNFEIPGKFMYFRDFFATNLEDEDYFKLQSIRVHESTGSIFLHFNLIKTSYYLITS